MNHDPSATAPRGLPRLSICLPVYNAVKFLPSALESIAQQTFRDFELVVVDDGSTDGSSEVASALVRQHGLAGRVERQANRGPEQARDRCVELARGKLLAPFDADDSWSPIYLESLVNVLDRHPEVELVYCDFIEHIQKSGRQIRKSDTATWIVRPHPSLQDPDLYVFPNGTFFSMLLQGQVLFPPCTIFRRTIYDTVGGYSHRLPELKISLDWYFGLRVSRVAGVAYLDKTLLSKSRHDSNISGNAEKTAASDVSVLESLIVDHHIPIADLPIARTKAGSRSFDVAYSLYQEGRNVECRRWLFRSWRHAPSTRAIRLGLMSLVPRPLVEMVRSIARGA